MKQLRIDGVCIVAVVICAEIDAVWPVDVLVVVVGRCAARTLVSAASAVRLVPHATFYLDLKFKQIAS